MMTTIKGMMMMMTMMMMSQFKGTSEQIQRIDISIMWNFDSCASMAEEKEEEKLLRSATAVVFQ
jgi:hypothetical protein